VDASFFCRTKCFCRTNGGADVVFVDPAVDGRDKDDVRAEGLGLSLRSSSKHQQGAEG